MSTATPSIGTGAGQEPQAIGSVTITIYALSPGQTQVQVQWPEAAKSGRPDVQTARQQVRQLVHAEIDRSFDAWGSR